MEPRPGRDKSRPYISSSFLKVHYHAHPGIHQQKGGYLSIYHAFAQGSRFHLRGGQCITSSHKPPSVSPNGRPEPLREALNGLEDQLASNRRRGICSTLSDKKISGNREGMLALSPTLFRTFQMPSTLLHSPHRRAHQPDLLIGVIIPKKIFDWPEQVTVNLPKRIRNHLVSRWIN